MQSVCQNCGSPSNGPLCENCIHAYQKLQKIVSEQRGVATSPAPPPPSDTLAQRNSSSDAGYNQSSLQQQPTSAGIVCQCFYCGLEGLSVSKTSFPFY